MNSSLDKLAKNLSDDDLNIWHEKSGSANIEVLKQKDSYPHDYMDSLKWFKGKKNKEYFFSSTKKGKIGEDCEKSDGHISHEKYWKCEKYLTWKIWVIIMIII